MLKGLKKDLQKIKTGYWVLLRKRKINRYFSDNVVRKLHLGSNKTFLEGWLCSDICPQHTNSIFLDVSKPFPFPDQSFDYIYSEHLIEHLSQTDGLFMLRECFRVLKKEGTIRIATPDLNTILNLYSKQKENFGKDYIKWSIDTFTQKLTGYNPVTVINTLFRNWGHVYLYDYTALSETLKGIGFIQTEQVEYGKSKNAELNGIEKHHINVGNAEMIKFETLIIEANKQ